MKCRHFSGIPLQLFQTFSYIMKIIPGILQARQKIPGMPPNSRRGFLEPAVLWLAARSRQLIPKYTLGLVVDKYGYITV